MPVLTGHSVRKMILKKLYKSLIFRKKVAYEENSRQIIDTQQESC
jgi:hypothetical protein